jgi:hypothetical protein
MKRHSAQRVHAASATTCSPSDGRRTPVNFHIGDGLLYPQSGQSATYKHTEVLFIIELRLDGGAAIRIPGNVILDDGLRSEILAYTLALSVHTPIPGCARPTAVFVGSVSLRDGAVVLAPIATASAPQSAMPTGRP